MILRRNTGRRCWHLSARTLYLQGEECQRDSYIRSIAFHLQNQNWPKPYQLIQSYMEDPLVVLNPIYPNNWINTAESVKKCVSLINKCWCMYKFLLLVYHQDHHGGVHGKHEICFHSNHKFYLFQASTVGFAPRPTLISCHSSTVRENFEVSSWKVESD